MTPIINLSKIRALNGCAKPGCTVTWPIYRHHKGSERFWVRHFATSFGGDEKRYRAFCTRYEEFRPEDCVPLCGDHHEECHEQYSAALTIWILKHPALWGRRMWSWSWDEAEALMQHYRGICDRWLKRESPGSTRRERTRLP